MKKPRLRLAKLLPKQTLLPQNDVRRLGVVYGVYRLVLSVFLLGSSLTSVNEDDKIPMLEQLTSGLYFFLAAVLLGLLLWSASNVRRQLLAGFGIDVIILSLLIYGSAVLEPRLVLLSMVVVAASFMLLTFAQAIIVIIVAVVIMLYQQLIIALTRTPDINQLADIALLSSGFIGVGLLSYAVTQRLAKAQQNVIAQRKQLMRLHHLNAQIIANITSGVLVMQRRELLLINDAAVRLLDLSVTRDALDGIASAHPMLLQWLLQPKGAYLHEFIQPDGSTQKLRLRTRPLDDSVSLILLDDVSQEEAHAQRLKLASLGGLAGSIAHEIRNPLGTILQSSQLLCELEESELAQMIVKQSLRIENIVRSVMDLSQQKPPTRVRLDIADWVSKFLKNQAPMVGMTQKSDLWVWFDPNHLEQIMVNLTQNALRHADASAPKVQIVLRTRDEWVMLDVLDNGDGVPDEHIPRLFTPFFTKSVGGTGLGLYLSQSFAHANGGMISYIANMGGACFRLKLERATPKRHRD